MPAAPGTIPEKKHATAEAMAEIDEDALFAAAEQSMGLDVPVEAADIIASSAEMDITMADYAAALDAVAEKVAEEPVVEETIEEEVVEETVEEEVAVEEPVVEETIEEAVVEETVEEEVAVEEPVTLEPVVEEVEEEVVEEEEEDFVSDEVATITKMMAINGDISSHGSIDVIGAIKGNVDVKGKLNILGTIIGNSQASEIYAKGATITGDITSSGAVKVGAGTVIRGNIYATAAVIAGAVKGDIDVHGPVVIDSTAIVMGNIKSKSVQINNGAAIEGMCSQCYADVSPSAFFKD